MKMGKLIRFEYNKLFRQRSFYICLIISIALIIVSTATIKLLERFVSGMTTENTATISVEMSEAEADDMEAVADVFTYNTGWGISGSAAGMGSCSIILCVFLSIFSCSEFEEGTIKNIVSRGYNRTKIYFSKYISAMTGSLIILVMVYVAAFCMGSILWESGSPGRTPEMIGYYLIGYLSYATFYFFIAMLFRKIGFSIAIGIVGPTFLDVSLSLLNMLLKLDKVKISDFWIDGCLTDISRISGPNPPDTKRLTIILICLLAYLVVLFGAGLLIGKKREV